MIMKIVNLGGLTLSGNMTFTVVSGVSSQFTLTCISIGGPATTVTWTRDNVTITEGTETALNDPVTAQYTHTLTVIEGLGGLYICTLANNRPSFDSRQYYVQGMWVWFTQFTYFVGCYLFFSVVPEIFEAIPGQRQVNFTWSPALVKRNNTLITNYTLYCYPSIPSLPLSLTHAGSFIVTGFTPDTVYSCSVVASDTLISQNMTFTTQQDCK